MLLLGQCDNFTFLVLDTDDGMIETLSEREVISCIDMLDNVVRGKQKIQIRCLENICVPALQTYIVRDKIWSRGWFFQLPVGRSKWLFTNDKFTNFQRYGEGINAVSIKGDKLKYGRSGYVNGIPMTEEEFLKVQCLGVH